MIHVFKTPEQELIDTIRTHSSVECPPGITLYRLKVGGSLYRIQIQDTIPHNILETTNVLRNCERQVE
jgi:hypothetical protein